MSRTRGFTLIEVMVVTAVIAIVMAVALPNFARLQTDAARRSVVRSAVNHLRFVRSTAMSTAPGQHRNEYRSVPGALTMLPLLAPPPAAALALTPASLFSAPPSYAGLRVLSPTAYQLMIRRNGTDQTLGLVVVNEDVRTMRIVSPVPNSEIRFSSRGYRDPSSSPRLILEDSSTGRRVAIDVSIAGLAQIQ